MKETQVKAIKARLKEKRGILLAHNYQPAEIQALADLTGDSLELSLKAAQTDAELIVFCGVLFMAETASIVSPDKTVLLPRIDAGCPMADMVTSESLQRRLAQAGSMPVVTYVNSSASVKAASTICCTSANVAAVVNHLTEEEILMVPDRNLAQYAATKTRKKIHYWDGYCPIHDGLTPNHVHLAKAAHPEALFMAHPECRPEVLALADAVLSTSGMLRFAKDSNRREFIVGTEEGLIHPLQETNPHKQFYRVSENMICRDMKKISPDDILEALEGEKHEIRVSENVRTQAAVAVNRMLEITNG
jgi:quinolinate synthase